MDKPYFNSIAPRSLLSFGPKSEPVALENLNVLIGPNGSGKSNLIEAFELLRATAGDLAGFIRQVGGPGEFLWKGPEGSDQPATVAAVLNGVAQSGAVQYRLEFAESSQRLEIVDEAIEETEPRKAGDPDVYFYYRFQRGRPAITMRQLTPAADAREKPRSQESILKSVFYSMALAKEVRYPHTHRPRPTHSPGRQRRSPATRSRLKDGCSSTRRPTSIASSSRGRARCRGIRCARKFAASWRGVWRPSNDAIGVSDERLDHVRQYEGIA